MELFESLLQIIVFLFFPFQELFCFCTFVFYVYKNFSESVDLNFEFIFFANFVDIIFTFLNSFIVIIRLQNRIGKNVFFFLLRHHKGIFFAGVFYFGRDL